MRTMKQEFQCKFIMFCFFCLCSLCFLPFASPFPFLFLLSSFSLSFTLTPFFPCFIIMILRGDHKGKHTNIWRINIVTANSDWSLNVWQNLAEGRTEQLCFFPCHSKEEMVVCWRWDYLSIIFGVPPCWSFLWEGEWGCHKTQPCEIALKDLWKVGSNYLLQVSW